MHVEIGFYVRITYLHSNTLNTISLTTFQKYKKNFSKYSKELTIALTSTNDELMVHFWMYKKFTGSQKIVICVFYISIEAKKLTQRSMIYLSDWYNVGAALSILLTLIVKMYLTD